MGGPTIDPIFSLRCVDCDAEGEPSRLWLRRSIERSEPRATGPRHYVECMNCGAHLKGRPDGRMESVDDDEWRSFVDEWAARGETLRPS